MTTKNHPFVLVDVFTDKPLTGNPLAVFLDADDLDASDMQELAREFNFSETTFVVSPRDHRATRRLRCFSPAAEVFGAGHNALGAWWAIIAGGHVSLHENGTVWQELGERVLPLEVTFDSSRLTRISMTQPTPQETDSRPDRMALSQALSIGVESLDAEALNPCVVAAGATRHLLVPVRDLGALTQVRVDVACLVALAKTVKCEGCYCYCLKTREVGSIAHARGFFPGIGIAEDPATGSAAGPLGAYLVTRGLAPRGEWLTIEQGDEMARRSRIQVRVTDDRVDVGGGCAVIGSGAISL